MDIPTRDDDRSTWKLVVLAYIVLLIMAVCGCGSIHHFPSAPSEMTVASIVMNECRKVGVTAKVLFQEEDSRVPGAPYGEPGQWLVVAMSAIVPDIVKVYPAAMDSPHSALVRYARHECCHLALGHKWTDERTEEAEAEACVAETDW